MLCVRSEEVLLLCKIVCMILSLSLCTVFIVPIISGIIDGPKNNMDLLLYIAYIISVISGIFYMYTIICIYKESKESKKVTPVTGLEL